MNRAVTSSVHVSRAARACLLAVVVAFAASAAGCLQPEEARPGTDEPLPQQLPGEGDAPPEDEEPVEPLGDGEVPVELRVTAHDNLTFGVFWFEVAELTGRNPLLVLAPGDEVHVRFENLGAVEHTLFFGGPIEEGTEPVPPDAAVWLNFTVPEDAEDWENGVAAEGDFEQGPLYWCEIHFEDEGMIGPLAFEPRDDGILE